MRLTWLVLLSALFSASALSSPPAKYPAPYTCTRNFYVATNGVDNGSCGSVGSPCASMQGANDNIALQGGDCVNFAAGTYNVTNTFQITLNKGGSSAAQDSNGQLNGYVTYIGAPNHGTILRATGGGYSQSPGCGPDTRSGGALYFFVRFLTNYLIMDGFEFNSNNNVEYTSIIAGGQWQDNNQIRHHHIVINNIIHDSGGSGISVANGQYYTIANNEIYNTATKSPCEESGISSGEPRVTGESSLPYDTQRFKIQILNNVLHDNQESTSIPSAQHTDGNGIILDDWRGDQFNGGPGAYPREALVAGNAVYHNGGRCVVLNTPPSGGLTVMNNTCYNNGLDSDKTICNGGNSELSVFSGGNNEKWANNIAWHINKACGSTITWFGNMTSTDSGPVWQANLTFTGTVGQNDVNVGSTSNDGGNRSTLAANNKVGTDPKLTDVAAPDFHPIAGSPVLGAGIAAPSGYTFFTPDGFPQPSPSNIGAYNGPMTARASQRR